MGNEDGNLNENKSEEKCNYVDVLSYTFGVYSTLKSLLTLSVGITSFVKKYTVTLLDLFYEREETENRDNEHFAYAYTAVLFGIIGVLFSLLLIIGIAKRKASFVLSFLVYTSIMVLFTIISFLVANIQLYNRRNAIAGSNWAVWIYITSAIALIGIGFVTSTLRRIIIEQRRKREEKRMAFTTNDVNTETRPETKMERFFSSLFQFVFCL